MSDETPGASRPAGRRKAGAVDRSGGPQQARGAMVLVLSLIQDLEQQGVLPAGSTSRIVQQAAEKIKAPRVKAAILATIAEGGKAGRKVGRKAARRADRNRFSEVT